jgi:hypothetical protein
MLVRNRRNRCHILLTRLCPGNKATPGTAPGSADINHEIHPKDNRYLILHEYLGFEPGDVQGLQAIREFISYRTEPSRSAAEKLHAVW